MTEIACSAFPKNPVLRVQYSFLLLTIGARCSQLAIAWWTLSEADSLRFLSLFTGAMMAAEIASKPLFGWVGDLYPKITIIKLSNAAAVIVSSLMFALAFNGVFLPWLLLAALVVSGIIVGIRDPLQASILSELLPANEVISGFRSKALMSSLSLVLGPALAGLLISLISIPACLVVDTLLIITALLLVRWKLPSSAGRKEGASRIISLRPATLIISGFRVAYIVRTERYLALLAMLLNIALYPFFALLVPFYVRNVLLMPAWYAGLIDACFGVGIMIGSRRMAWKSWPRFHRDFLLMIGLLLLGVNMFAIGLWPNTSLTPIYFFMGGVGLILFNLNVSVVRNLATPAEFRNRMLATISFISQSASPLGVWAVGAITINYGFFSTVTASGLLVCILSVGLLAVPKLRYFMRLPDSELSDAYQRAFPEAFKCAPTA